MREIFKDIETPYIDAQTLLILLADYSKPRETILRLVKKGELIRLKNGFYLIKDKIELGTIPYEQVANLLYGPSYVSLQWALSFYGMIPERVHSITSMTLGRNKEYFTPVGDFFYYSLPSASYSVGVNQKQMPAREGSFLIATPEKALVDLVFKTCKGLNKKQLQCELLESRRLEGFSSLDKNLLLEIASSYRSKSVRHLMDVVKVL